MIDERMPGDSRAVAASKIGDHHGRPEGFDEQVPSRNRRVKENQPVAVPSGLKWFHNMYYQPTPAPIGHDHHRSVSDGSRVERDEKGAAPVRRRERRLTRSGPTRHGIPIMRTSPSRVR